MEFDFEKAVPFYTEHGKNLLLKLTIAHGHSSYAEEQLQKAFMDEGLSLEFKVVQLPAEKEDDSFQERMDRLDAAWRIPFKKAAFLHAERSKIIREDYQLIKFGRPLESEKTKEIARLTVEIHRIISQEVEPAWKELDELRVLGRIPDPVFIKEPELPSTVSELVKIRNNLRTYVTKAKKGQRFKKTLQQLEEELDKVETKIKEIETVDQHKGSEHA